MSCIAAIATARGMRFFNTNKCKVYFNYRGWADGKWDVVARDPCKQHRLNNNAIDIR